jgi:hypothetical protein
MCYFWSNNLKIGDTGEVVYKLKMALSYEGFLDIDSVQQNVRAGMIFDESTASAVVGFQQKYANEILAPNGLSFGTGYVGVSTRAKLNSIFKCNEMDTITLVDSIYNGQTENYFVETYQTQDIDIGTEKGLSAEIKLIDAENDKVWAEFGPGVGIGNKNPNDWHWRMKINSDKDRVVTEMFMKSNTPGEGWSTTNNLNLMGKLLYPLHINSKLFKNTEYNQKFTIYKGENRIDLYGQPDITPFVGARLYLKFEDGSSVSFDVPPALHIKQKNHVTLTESEDYTEPIKGMRIIRY